VRVVHGLTAEEVGHALSTFLVAVRQRLFRARHMVRRMLTHEARAAQDARASGMLRKARNIAGTQSMTKSAAARRTDTRKAPEPPAKLEERSCSTQHRSTRGADLRARALLGIFCDFGTLAAGQD
jgi:hypothetical protein